LEAEYLKKGFYSFLLFGFSKGQASSFFGQEEDRNFVTPCCVIEAYIRYVNYVLVPFGKRARLHVKHNFYIFPVGLMQHFEKSGPSYACKNMPPAQHLLLKDFWLIPHNHNNKHWSLVVVCYPNVREKTFIAVLDSCSQHLTLPNRLSYGLALNSRTFLVYEHLRALNLPVSKKSFDAKVSRTPIRWINVPQQRQTMNDPGSFLM
jgi:hypothetical protein